MKISFLIVLGNAIKSIYIVFIKRSWFILFFIKVITLCCLLHFHSLYWPFQFLLSVAFYSAPLESLQSFLFRLLFECWSRFSNLSGRMSLQRCLFCGLQTGSVPTVMSHFRFLDFQNCILDLRFYNSLLLQLLCQKGFQHRCTGNKYC